MSDINHLREILFNTLKELQNPDSKLDIERAKAINEISQTVINSAKVEVDYLKNIGGKGTDFIPMVPFKDNKQLN